MIGRRSNRNGIGARIELTAGNTRMMREVTAGGSYLSSGDMRVHFGLGMSTTAVTITIHWPSGNVQTIEGITPRQLLTVDESKL
ncbi:MAG: ASPIC/UnbV domain-containing protein [Acidobacteria bacterium]|nr:ASPIC/UnbV domain-containing protein [Acidobacteriota bacterium]